ncbi:hypothetical protein SAMN05444157_0723 [Frankineae bacterium MT45]|nr:hypothetical protein SAMN05444157_0723 [Frankineae bacterium MT45]
MHDPLHRLYRTKLVLLATVLMFLGLGLLIFGHWAPRTVGWQWTSNWPVVDIGSALFTTGLLGVAWQYVDGQDSEERDTERLRRILAESAPSMRDAVIRGFAFEPSDLARVSTPEVLDQIITNGLAIRLGDASFAADIYDDLRKQAIDMPERLEDARVSIRLSPLPMGRGTANGRASLFAVTMRWEYKLKPVHTTRRFVCTSDLAEFHDLDADDAGTSVWYFQPKGDITAEQKEAYELLDFTVDGKARTIRRTSKAASQTYTVNIGTEAIASAEPVTVAYTYRTVSAVEGHRLRLRVDQPMKGLSVELDYTDTDLTHVAVLDFIASGQRTRISRAPSTLPERALQVEFDGWVFSRSGLAFVWK